MKLTAFKHNGTGRRIAAFVAVLAFLCSSLLAVTCNEYAGLKAGAFDTVAHMGSSVSMENAGIDKDVPSSEQNITQDCAFHCDHHGRGLPSVLAAQGDALPKAPKLLALRDDASAVAQPDGLLEPPKA